LKAIRAAVGMILDAEVASHIRTYYNYNDNVDVSKGNLYEYF